MRKLLVITSLIPLFSSSQKTNFSIQVAFKRIVPAKHVYVFMNDERRIDTLLYPSNDTLIYSGTINNPGTFQIGTDSSSSPHVWVDGQPVSVSLEEERTRIGSSYFKIINLEGSEDSKLLFQMTQPRALTSGFIPASLSKEDRDSILKAFRFKNYIYPYNIIDSIFSARPKSPIIPFYIRFYQRTLGPDTVALFYKRLNFVQQNY
jgi:hypothetical protein